MALDPRLQDTTLLALAALRAKERQQTPPLRPVTVQIVYYDARGIEEETQGASYTYYLPAE